MGEPLPEGWARYQRPQYAAMLHPEAYAVVCKVWPSREREKHAAGRVPFGCSLCGRKAHVGKCGPKRPGRFIE